MVTEYVDEADMILIMTVEPGWYNFSKKLILYRNLLFKQVNFIHDFHRSLHAPIEEGVLLSQFFQNHAKSKKNLIQIWYLLLFLFILSRLHPFLQPLLHNMNTLMSNYCFDSLAIRLQPKDLKHLIPRPGRSGL